MAASDNTGPSPDGSTPPWITSELLCFLTDKCNVLPMDDLVKVCTDFYTEAEIMQARSVIDSVGVRLPKRTRSADRLRLTVEDIAKCIIDPMINLPEFYAKNLARLPPVDFQHCDASAILLELRALRAEVRNIGHMKAEIETLKAELDACKKEIGELKVAEAVAIAEWPRINRQSTKKYMGVSNSSSTEVDASTSGATSQAKEKKPLRKEPVIGVSQRTQSVKSVTTTRSVEVFISRLHPLTSGYELLDCAKETATDAGVELVDVTYTKLKAKQESLYSSFHVSIKVGSNQFKSAIDLFMSGEAWPCGVLVKRFFKPKNG